MTGKKFLALGELLMDDYGDRRHPGGAPANVAAHMARFGMDSSLFSAVGRDGAGDELLAFLTRHKVKTDFVERVDYPSGRVLVTLNNGIPEYEIVKDSAWDHLRFREVPVPDAIYFGTLAQRAPESRAAIRRMVENCPGALRICDVNLRQNYFDVSVLEWSLRHCDLLKLNDEELPVIADLFRLPPQPETLAGEFGIRTLVLTLGKDGSAVYTGGAVIREAPYPCRKKNTVGAGDAFTAAFTAGILSGESPGDAQARANRVAARVCEHESAVPEPSDFASGEA